GTAARARSAAEGGPHQRDAGEEGPARGACHRRRVRHGTTRIGPGRRPVNRNMRKISCVFSHEDFLARDIVSSVNGAEDRDGSWTLLTGHGHVLVEIARNPRARIRDISAAAGVTERTAQAIVSDLEAAGYITRTRIGRRTRYTVNRHSLFRH